MTTIIERPSGEGDSSLVMLAIIVGALAAIVIGLFAFGMFDRAPATENTLTIETPAAPAAEAAPAAPAAEAAPAASSSAADRRGSPTPPPHPARTWATTGT